MTTLKGWLQKEHPEWEDDPEFIVDGILLDLVYDLNFDYDELAAKSGIHKRTLERFLNANDPRVSLLTLAKIAKAIGKKLVVQFEEITKDE